MEIILRSHFLNKLFIFVVLLFYTNAITASDQIGDLYYNLDSSTRTASVTYYSSTANNSYYVSGSLTIPSSVTYSGRTYSVTSIGSWAFRGCSRLTSVTIPEGVTSIGSSAFDGCSGLTSVTIPSSVTSIDDYAFRGCSGLPVVNGIRYADVVAVGAVDKSLTTYTLKEGTRLILSFAFSGCSGLTFVTIPSSVTSIGSSAFYGCSGLTSVTIPEGVTSIGSYAFKGCSGLTSVTIPEGVTSIGNAAFSGCSGLTSVTIPEGVTSIGSEAFCGCSGLTSITIPSSVTSIGKGAFHNCSGLTEITIPFIGLSDSEELWNSLFGAIFGEEEYSGGEETVQHYYFGSSGDQTKIYYIPSSLRKVKVLGGHVKYGAFSGCSKLTTIEIPNSLTMIEASAFAGCSALTSITIPSSITSIGSSAFAGCVGLTRVDYKGNITGWCKISFENSGSNPCSNAHCLYIDGIELGHVSIPLSCKKIANYAFYGNSSLSSIVIPSSVTSIGNYAFSYCSGLTSVTISEGVTSIGDYAFSNCSRLTSVTIPEGVTSIGKSAFYDCSGLTSVTIPSSVSSINSWFYGCCNLEELAFPFVGTVSAQQVEVTTFANVCLLGALFGQSNFTGAYLAEQYCTHHNYPNYSASLSGYRARFYIPETLKKVTITGGSSIPIGAFSNCKSLEQVIISSEKITSIRDCAFYTLPKLKSVFIPESVTNYDYFSFEYCGTANIYIKRIKPTSLGSSKETFSNNVTISVPIGTLSAYKLAWSNYEEQIVESALSGALLDENATPKDVITEAATSDDGVDITFRRVLTKDRWNSLVIPFAMTADEVEKAFGEGTKVAKLKSSATGKVTFVVQQTNDIEANVPVLVMATKDVSEEYLKGKMVNDDNAEIVQGDARFVGTYTKLTGNLGANTYFLSDGELIPTSHMGTLKPFRAYLHLTNTNGVKPILEISELDGRVTNISAVEVSGDDCVKDGTYDLLGRKVNDLHRGVTVRNGKKYMNK